MKQITTEQQQAETTSLVEHVLIQGDLSQLSPQNRIDYYNGLCASLGLNPLTRPLEYIKFNGKITLYAKKGATDQLRTVHGISITNVSVVEEGGFYIATATATNRDGVLDTDVGVVKIPSSGGDDAANAYKKAVTQAKRRVTLGMGGLGLLDQTEVDQTNGVIVEQPQDARLYDYLMEDVCQTAVAKYGGVDAATTKLNEIAAAIGRRRGMADLTIMEMTVEDLQFIKDGYPSANPSPADVPLAKGSSESPVGYSVPVDVDELLGPSEEPLTLEDEVDFRDD